MKFRKTIALLTAVISAASVVMLTAAGTAYPYGASNVLHLQDALLCRENVIAADDVNADGTVNAFDLGILKKQLHEDAGDPVTQSYAATEEYVKITGRNVQKDDVTWLVQSGSAVEFTISGTAASVQLAGDSGIGNGEDFRPRYAVYVDGELLIDTTMSTETETITLFEGSTARMAAVKVILLSEAMYGGIGIKSVEVTSSSPVPMQPAAENELLIEFIGDSITCAYGVEGASSSESFKTTTENFTKSYAYLTAQQLGADYSAVSYSGHGIVSGYSSGDKNADSLVPDVYEQTSKYWEYTQLWDFEKRQNDVVVINLGTNDINYVAAEPETRNQEFIDGYAAFLAMIRKNNLDAYIICTLGTMGGSEIYDLIEQAVDTYKESSGDERVMSYESVTQNIQTDGIGSDWHPSPVTQQNSAYVLADKICQALGMESSQIGLNIAADSVYTYDSNTDSGANVYGYVNDYDKSFWINVMTGGETASDIQAYIPDLQLKQDGEYRVEFDYTCTAESDIPVIMYGNSSTMQHICDSIAPASEKTHYEATFTAPYSEDGVLIFRLGGQDNYNLTLYNIKIVKIS